MASVPSRRTGLPRAPHCGRCGGAWAKAPRPRARPRVRAEKGAAAKGKTVWCETTDEGTILEALKQGVDTFLFDVQSEYDRKEADKWLQACRKKLDAGAGDAAEVKALFREEDQIVDVQQSLPAAKFFHVSGPGDAAALSEHVAQSEGNETFIVAFGSGDPDEGAGSDVWKIIPAESLVALKGSATKVLAVASSSAEAQTMLSILEAGMDGVVLQTEQQQDVIEVAQALKATRREALSEASVTEIVYEGLGDRACVDLCENLKPGEGMLVGSFSRGLFLVHSECEESAYINSRPFRVNAGPVHSYVLMPNNRTAYLSELKAGDEVLVVDPKGGTRVCTLGRVKIEHRPLVKISAKLSSGDTIVCHLQNAETVKLLCGRTEHSPGHGGAWEAVPVNELQIGSKVLVFEQHGARHTGIAVEEQITER